MDERISWYPIAERETLAPETQTLFAQLEEKLGFVPNVFRAFAWRGVRFDKWRAHFEELMQPSPGLGKAEREMILGRRFDAERLPLLPGGARFRGAGAAA